MAFSCNRVCKFLLLNAGASLEETDCSGETALMIAATYGHADLAQWLIDNRSPQA